MNRRTAHDVKVGLFGLAGSISFFLIAFGLACFGSYMETKTQESGTEESSMFIEESSLDDIRDEMEQCAIEINGEQYIRIDTAMELLQGYLDEED